MKDTYQILVPTDYSETADHALNIGIDLANRIEAKIQVLHIENIRPGWVAMVEKSESSLYYNVKDQLTLVKKQLSDRVALARNKGSQTEGFLEYANGYKVILSHAKKHKADLIVMGAHGRSGLKGILVGSYTQRVLYHTHLPVLAMKKVDQPNRLRRMVFVSDFSPVYKNAFNRVIRFAETMGIKLHLLFLNTKVNFRESHDIESRMNDYLEKAPAEMVESVDIVNSFIFEDGLTRYCEAHHIDIVSVTIHSKYHSWRALGSSIESIINHLNIPVLGVPEQ